MKTPQIKLVNSELEILMADKATVERQGFKPIAFDFSWPEGEARNTITLCQYGSTSELYHVTLINGKIEEVDPVGSIKGYIET